MKITLKWRRDNGREEVLVYRSRETEIEVHVDRTREITRADYRAPGKRAANWNPLKPAQPIWRDLEAAVVRFFAERDAVLAGVDSDAAKALGIRQ